MEQAQKHEIIRLYNAAVAQMANACEMIDAGSERAESDYVSALGRQSGIRDAMETLGYEMIIDDTDEMALDIVPSVELISGNSKYTISENDIARLKQLYGNT